MTLAALLAEFGTMENVIEVLAQIGEELPADLRKILGQRLLNDTEATDTDTQRLAQQAAQRDQAWTAKGPLPAPLGTVSLGSAAPVGSTAPGSAAGEPAPAAAPSSLLPGIAAPPPQPGPATAPAAQPSAPAAPAPPAAAPAPSSTSSASTPLKPAA